MTIQFTRKDLPANLSDPSLAVMPITPDDDSFLTNPVRGVYVGGEGDISLTAFDGSEAVFKAVPAGTVLPVVTIKVNEAGTSATSIVGLM